MKPHRYTCFKTQLEMSVLRQRLEGSKITLIVLGHVFALGLLLAPLVAAWVAPFFWVALAALGACLSWRGGRAWALSRKIARLGKEVQS